MNVPYNLYKLSNEYHLNVLVGCTVTVFFIEKGRKLLKTIEAIAGDFIILPDSEDGKYEVVLTADSYDDTAVNYTITKHLEKSIILDAYEILCGNDAGCGCKNPKTNCLSKEGKQALRTREVFVKLFVFQSRYVPRYSPSYSQSFNTFVEKAIETNNCGVQKDINQILMSECLGSTSNSRDLLQLYVAVYWCAMYFLAVNKSAGEPSSIQFIKELYLYDSIIECICEVTCLKVEDLEDLFEGSLINNAPSVDDSFPTISPMYIPAENYSYTFKTSDFTTNYEDPESDAPNNVRIEAVPAIGYLTYSGAVVSNGFEFNIKNVANLKYIIPANISFKDTGVYQFDKPVQAIIDQEVVKGSRFVSYIEETLTFAKETLQEVSNKTNMYAFFDTTSMQEADGIAAKDALEIWFTAYKANNPNYSGNLYILCVNSENWLYHASIPQIGKMGISTYGAWTNLNNLPPNFNTNAWEPDLEAIVFNFIDESNSGYHDYTLTNGDPFTHVRSQILQGSKVVDIENFINAQDFNVDNTTITNVTVTGTLGTTRPISEYVIPDRNTVNGTSITINTLSSYVKPDNVIFNNSSGLFSNEIVQFNINDGSNTGVVSISLRNLIPELLIPDVQPTPTYQYDYDKFVELYSNYKFFRGFLYPIRRTVEGDMCIIQMVAALKGRTLTQEEIDKIDTGIDLSPLLSTNPYENFQSFGSTMKPLEDFNFKGIFNKTSPADEVFSSQTFQNDIDLLLSSSVLRVLEEYEIKGTNITNEVSTLFKISDNNTNELFSNMAKVQFNIDAYQNLPISVLGDRSITLANRGTVTFTVADFTTLLSPAYEDPEGDPLDAIRIDSLPASGTLTFNGSAATVGQVVTASDLSAGRLVFTAPDSDSSASPEFNFSARDTGSMEWIS